MQRNQPDAAPRERRPFTPRRTEDRGSRRERPAFGESPGRPQTRCSRADWKRPGSAGPRENGHRVLPKKMASESRPRRTAAGEGFRSHFVRVPANLPERRARNGSRAAKATDRVNFRRAVKPVKAADLRSRIAAAQRAQGSSAARAAAVKAVANSSRAHQEDSVPAAKKAAKARRNPSAIAPATGDQAVNLSLVKAVQQGRHARNGSRAREGEERSEFRPRRTEGGEGARRPFGKPAGDRKPAGKSFSRERGPAGPRKEWKPRREGEERPSFGHAAPKAARAHENLSANLLRDRKPAGKSFSRERGPAGPRKEWKPRREGEERREFRPRTEGDASERRPFKPRPAGGSFRPSRGRRCPRRQTEIRCKTACQPRRLRPQEAAATRACGRRRHRTSEEVLLQTGQQRRQELRIQKERGKNSSFGGKRPGGKRPNNRKGKKSGE